MLINSFQATFILFKTLHDSLKYGLWKMIWTRKWKRTLSLFISLDWLSLQKKYFMLFCSAIHSKQLLFCWKFFYFNWARPQKQHKAWINSISTIMQWLYIMFVFAEQMITNNFCLFKTLFEQLKYILWIFSFQLYNRIFLIKILKNCLDLVSWPRPKTA